MFSRIRQALAVTTVAAAMCTVASVGTAHADTAKDRCLFISTPYAETSIAQVRSNQGCGPSGTYHIRIHGGGFDRDYANFGYNGGTLHGVQQVDRSFPAGTRLCAQLWYHNSGGGYDLWGEPCVTLG